MRNSVKAVITTDTKTMKREGVLHLLLSGDNLEQVKAFIIKRKLAPGSPVLFSLDDKESKSGKQLRTIHLLIRIYDKFLQANIEGYIDIHDLKNTIKYKYGMIDYWEAPDKKVIATLKSFADYKIDEMTPVISGLFDEMIKVFSEYNYHDERFQDMVKEFNDQKIQAVKNVFEGEIF